MIFIVAAASLLLSLVGKFLADTYLHRHIALVSRYVGLEPVSNSGIAFGLRIPGRFQELLILGAILFVLLLARRARSSIQQISFGLILGGALGNLLDRFLDGTVTDFFQVGLFPVFNVADSCITAGVLLLLLESLVRGSAPAQSR